MLKVSMFCALALAVAGAAGLAESVAIGQPVSDHDAMAIVGGACSDQAITSCSGTAQGCETTTCMCIGTTVDDQEPSSANACGDESCGAVGTSKDCNS
jgi:hypothetical protein